MRGPGLRFFEDESRRRGTGVRIAVLLVALTAGREAFAQLAQATQPAQPASSGDPASFEARVVGSNVYALSGPGIGYYPTSLLAPGSTVTVTGQRQGDWYKIVPPDGSFSWIPTEAVEEKSDGTGVVAKDGVQVRVGSSFNKDHYVYQVTLNTGDVVQILDRGFLADEGGIGEWYRIVPPAREVRYVAANQVKAPGDSPQKLPADFDPIPAGGIPVARPRPGPVNLRAIPPAQIRYPTAEPTVQTTQTDKPSIVPLNDDASLSVSERLDLISGQLDRMRSLPPQHWNVTDAGKILEELYAAAASDEDKRKVLALDGWVDQLKKIQERCLRAQRRHELTIARDHELRVQQERLMRSLTGLRPRYDAQGVLERTGFESPQWKLSDKSGVSTHFVVAPPGMDLQKYAGMVVGLLGAVEQREGVSVPTVRVEQLIPLDDAAPANSTAAASGP